MPADRYFAYAETASARMLLRDVVIDDVHAGLADFETH